MGTKSHYKLRVLVTIGVYSKLSLKIPIFNLQITDFGLSKYTSSSNEANGGTIEYMPPEAFQEGYKPSEASDVYR